MECDRCKIPMALRKSRRAGYDAPEIFVCPKCGQTLIKYGDEVSKLEDKRYSER